MKRCYLCNQVKPLNEFYRCKTTKDRRRGDCISCHKELNLKGKEKLRWYNLKKFYGLSQKQYEYLYKIQNGVCAICKKLNLDGANLFVDHNHVTGQVRGLLCLRCNMAIGVFEKDISLFYEAADYVEGFPTRHGSPMALKSHVNPLKHEGGK